MSNIKILAFILLLGLSPLSAAKAQGDTPATGSLPVHSLGSPNAPIVMEEFLSMTCSHCADYVVHTMPALQDSFVEQGLVRLVFRDFPLDGISLRASALARCLPDQNYLPFIKLLMSQHNEWLQANDPEAELIKYAALVGLPAAKAKACLSDENMMDRILEERMAFQEKYDIKATPTFILNGGDERVTGAQEAKDFEALFRKMLQQMKASTE